VGDQLQKFEVRRASRDIIHYGGATVYAVTLGPGQEGQGAWLSLRSLLWVQEGLLTWQQITQSPQPYIQTFSRTKSSKANEDSGEGLQDGGEVPQGGKLMDKLMSDLSNGDMPLDNQLKRLGVNPDKFKEYGSDYTHDRSRRGG
jgi:hypothetical protein